MGPLPGRAPEPSGGGANTTADWARPVVHWAITARDPEAQRAFYAALFNWSIEGDGLMNIGAGIGGPEPGPAGHIQQGDVPGVSLYEQVRADPNATASVSSSSNAQRSVSDLRC